MPTSATAMPARANTVARSPDTDVATMRLRRAQRTANPPSSSTSSAGTAMAAISRRHGSCRLSGITVVRSWRDVPRQCRTLGDRRGHCAGQARAQLVLSGFGILGNSSDWARRRMRAAARTTGRPDLAIGLDFMSIRNRIAVVTAIALAAAGSALAQAQDLVFSVTEGVTYQATPKEVRDKFEPLAEALGKALKRNVRIVLVPSYADDAAGPAGAAIRHRVHPSRARRARGDQGRQVQGDRVDGRLHRIHGDGAGRRQDAAQVVRRRQGSLAGDARARLDHLGDGQRDAARREVRRRQTSR